MRHATIALLGLSAICTAAEPAQDQVSRGKYLVTRVAMCIDCHSPRGKDGQFIQDKWLQGGPLTFKSTVPMPWGDFAFPINGGGPWSDEHLRTLLTTAKRPDGSMPRPPMPAYEMSREDADAVIAYLRSVR